MGGLSRCVGGAGGGWIALFWGVVAPPARDAVAHLGGSGWRWTRSQVIQSIEAKTNTFYTKVGVNRAEIGVVNGPNGKYVRTYADGKWNDNLLALPECTG